MIYFKISRNQMNRALTVLNNANKELEKRINNYVKEHNLKENEVETNFSSSNFSYYLDLKDKKVALERFLEYANFSIKQTKLKEFWVDYDFAKVIKKILFIEEKTK